MQALIAGIIVKLVESLIQKGIPFLVEWSSKKLAIASENTDVKKNLKKAVKIKDRQHRADNILNTIKR